VPGSSKFIQPEDLPAELQPKIPANATDRSMNAKDFESKVKFIERALVETGGNLARASRILELSASYVHRFTPRDCEEDLSAGLPHNCSNTRLHCLFRRHNCEEFRLHCFARDPGCRQNRQHCR
jgi:hypothetical protein